MSNGTKIKVTYIGGGSRNWSWKLMSDLAKDTELCGEVALYDIDLEAARCNEIIGNKSCSNFRYKAVETLEASLRGADVVIISILPGTFDEMESDVHLPEEYGIYQSVGDTTGPGGLIRAARTIPMIAEIAEAVREYCPKAFVINYTNPMAMCVQTLYEVFPEINAIGCCHEVFHTQQFVSEILMKTQGLKNINLKDIKVNIKGTNHFTWFDSMYYKQTDLFPLYREYCEKNLMTAAFDFSTLTETARPFKSAERVKMDLFLRFGAVAAAGDRHLAEFCPGEWYLADKDTPKKWGFMLTTLELRRKKQAERMKMSADMISGDMEFPHEDTGEEGVQQIKAFLGLGDFTTNVNLPNRGQIPFLPLGSIVETNAFITAGQVRPVFAGAMPDGVYGLTARVVDNYNVTVKACLRHDIEGIFPAFTNDPLVTIDHGKARELFVRMVKNTSKYLKMYDLKNFK